MHIAVLGGSFDPPHLGHLLLTTQITKHFPVDQIWLMPCYQHPFHKQLSAAKYRLAMTRLLENDILRVSDLEIKKGDTSYSIETLQQLNTQYPSFAFSWIIGSDRIPEFPKWRDWPAIIEKFGLVIYPRDTHLSGIPSLLKQTFHWQSIPDTVLYPKQSLPTSPISSTMIRERVKNNQSITDLVTPEVAAYIMEKRLYE